MIDEFEDQARIDAEEAIRAARVPPQLLDEPAEPQEAREQLEAEYGSLIRRK